MADADVAITGPYQQHRRMTLTYPMLNRARRILWLVTGDDKPAMLAKLRAAIAGSRPAGSARTSRKSSPTRRRPAISEGGAATLLRQPAIRERTTSMIKRIGIMGAGAIGCVVGGMLTRAGHDVTLIDQWPAHVEAMKANGLRLSGTSATTSCRSRRSTCTRPRRIQEPFDAVFLAVKAYDTEWATVFVMRYLAEPDGVIVDFQNGINDERVAAVAGRERTLGCVITIGAGMYEPGHAMRTDTGDVGFKIGELDGEDTAARPRAGRDHERRRGQQGDDQPVRRALVQAGRQLHGEPDRRPERLRLDEVRTDARCRAASRSRSAAEAIAVGRGGRLRGRADHGHRGPAVRRRREGAASPTLEREMAAGARARWRRPAVAAPGRDARPAHRDRGAERLRRGRGEARSACRRRSTRRSSREVAATASAPQARPEEPGAAVRMLPPAGR